MKRTTPLRAKPKYKSAELKRYHDWIAGKGCLVCSSPACVHHVTAYADRPGRISRSDWLVVPLCPAHHQHDYGPLSVERLGHQKFFSIHGIDLYDEAVRYAEKWHARAA